MNSQQILDQIRAEFRAMKQVKRGLQGNRIFMDSGWENAEYPAGTQFVPFDADGIHAETVFISPNSIENNSSDKKIILHCHGGGYAVGSTLSHRPYGNIQFQTGARKQISLRIGRCADGVPISTAINRQQKYHAQRRLWWSEPCICIGVTNPGYGITSTGGTHWLVSLAGFRLRRQYIRDKQTERPFRHPRRTDPDGGFLCW